MSFYYIIFAITLIPLAYIIRESDEDDAIYDIVLPKGFRYECKKGDIKGIIYLFIAAILCCIFLIAIYGFRVGIGDDYAAYEGIFNSFHTMDYATYKLYYSSNYEIAYYVLNRIAPSYMVLNFFIYIIILLPIWAGIFLFKGKTNPACMFFIYLSIDFIYSATGVRFSIALPFIFLGYIFLINEKDIGFFACIIIAVLFHRMAVLSIVMYVFRDWKNVKVNWVRNILFYSFIIIFPFVVGHLFELFSHFGFFDKYFSAYVLEFDGWHPTWLLHIVPVLTPIIVIFRKELFEEAKTEVMFNICLSEIIFRMMAEYNQWLIRLCRISQLIQIVFIPYMLNKIENDKLRRALYLYYTVWYIFYCAYYAIIIDKGGMIPYTWIFGSIDIP